MHLRKKTEHLNKRKERLKTEQEKFEIKRQELEQEKKKLKMEKEALEWQQESFKKRTEYFKEKKEAFEAKKKELEQENQSLKSEIENLKLQNDLNLTLKDIDEMDGFEFEEYAKSFFVAKGFEVEITQKSGDYGADLICEKGDKRMAVQAKCYSQPVSIKAIQEVVGAKSHYGCQEACVITNNHFTKSAQNLANSNGVMLIGRGELARFIANKGLI
ncbi:restriction endonuclease [Helicobacter cetorum]